MKIAMIMLAAGNSRRFGANKLLYEIDGIPMYRHVLEQLDDTKKKIENIYSEYSDITEDNNNDNNSDIVQLNNLYRNNITAKIICNIIVITQYDAIAEAVKTKEIQVLYNPPSGRWNFFLCKNRSECQPGCRCSAFYCV